LIGGIISPGNNDLSVGISDKFGITARISGDYFGCCQPDNATAVCDRSVIGFLKV
jgi:hypothetical protein